MLEIIGIGLLVALVVIVGFAAWAMRGAARTANLNDDPVQLKIMNALNKAVATTDSATRRDLLRSIEDVLKANQYANDEVAFRLTQAANLIKIGMETSVYVQAKKYADAIGQAWPARYTDTLTP